MITIGERVRDIRKARGLSQQQLATAMGLAKPTIALWETGRRGIALAQLRKLANVLKTPLSNLLGEDGNGKIMRLTDPAERAVIMLYRQIDPALRQKCVELLSACVDLRVNKVQQPVRYVPNGGDIGEVAISEPLA